MKTEFELMYSDEHERGAMLRALARRVSNVFDKPIEGTLDALEAEFRRRCRVFGPINATGVHYDHRGDAAMQEVMWLLIKDRRLTTKEIARL